MKSSIRERFAGTFGLGLDACFAARAEISWNAQHGAIWMTPFRLWSLCCTSWKSCIINNFLPALDMALASQLLIPQAALSSAVMFLLVGSLFGLLGFDPANGLAFTKLQVASGRIATTSHVEVMNQSESSLEFTLRHPDTVVFGWLSLGVLAARIAGSGAIMTEAPSHSITTFVDAQRHCTHGAWRKNSKMHGQPRWRVVHPACSTGSRSA